MEFRSARSTDEALAMLAQDGTNAKVLAGGTDLMVQLARNEIGAGLLIHIQRVSDLSGISLNGHLSIGAVTTLRAIAESQDIHNGYSSLAIAAASVGGWQTQVVGTIGGNVANASPAADLVPPLLVHGASVVLASEKATRSLPIEQFITGRRSTVLTGDELIVRINLESVPERSADKYVKVGRRSAMEVSIVGIAVRLTLAEDLTTVTDARIAVCSCGPSAFRADSAASVLIGRQLTANAISEAGEHLVAQAKPIDDVRASASYRLRLLPRVLN
ncbi:MAG: FAD binding domain-containing protein, partial [Chloroflexi bacterium]|nr:FAD binding domain-containing protein [Chloroflexota bacterium]